MNIPAENAAADTAMDSPCSTSARMRKGAMTRTKASSWVDKDISFPWIITLFPLLWWHIRMMVNKTNITVKVNNIEEHRLFVRPNMVIIVLFLRMSSPLKASFNCAIVSSLNGSKTAPAADWVNSRLQRDTLRRSHEIFPAVLFTQSIVAAVFDPFINLNNTLASSFRSNLWRSSDETQDVIIRSVRIKSFQMIFNILEFIRWLVL